MLSKEPFVCPSDLLAKARSERPTATAVAGAASEVALESARAAQREGLIEPLLVGDPQAIGALAEKLAWDISGITVIAAESEAAAARQAVALCRDGRAASLMKGQVHTDALMRAVVDREQGLRCGQRLSHVFYMTAPHRSGALAITDAAVNVAPNVDQRLDIARNAVALFHALGKDTPKVAVLSATETPNPSMPSSLEAAEIAERAGAGEIAGAEVAGPLALDVAISPQAAALKGVDNPVAGRADILLVPNIETGNALFKSMVYFMSATAAGLVLGARVPIILTSRADPPEARLAAAALAAILARHQST
jgi:phosphate acetyltransferase